MPAGKTLPNPNLQNREAMYRAINPKLNGRVVMTDVTEEQKTAMQGNAAYKNLVFQPQTDKIAPKEPVGVTKEQPVENAAKAKPAKVSDEAIQGA